MIGTRARVAEVLNRKRGLSIEMIRKLNKGLGIPGDVLIRPTILKKQLSQKVAFQRRSASAA
jgi:plasmid maintenance system antidote protein VapI